MELIREITETVIVKTHNDVYSYLSEFKNEDKEYFIVLGLDTINKVLYREIVGIGTLNYCSVHPRETFKKAIIMSCNSIIIAHNHPSGNCKPSNDDITFTKKIRDCGEILGINLLDSIIISNNGNYSFEEDIGIKNV